MSYYGTDKPLSAENAHCPTITYQRTAWHLVTVRHSRGNPYVIQSTIGLRQSPATRKLYGSKAFPAI